RCHAQCAIARRWGDQIKRAARGCRAAGLCGSRSRRRWVFHGSASKPGRGPLRPAEHGPAASTGGAPRAREAGVRRDKSKKLHIQDAPRPPAKPSAGSLAEGRRVLAIEARAVQALIDRLDEQFNKAVDLLFQCKGKVVVSGMGKSGLVGQKIAATM